ncbi:MAG: sugar O-acetyltransferase [Pseudomonadota bacterium]
MTARSEKQKMLAGELYRAGDPELRADSLRAAEWMDRYNAQVARSPADRHALLSELFAAVGSGATIRPPFHCDYGYNIRLGDGVFLNFGCVVLDVMRVDIGDLTQIASGVQILTADHPRDAETRRSGLENGRPVTIGRNCWIGAAAVLLPGITVGDDAIIGAGAIVTRDVAPGQTVVGNPARPTP